MDNRLINNILGLFRNINIVPRFKKFYTTISNKYRDITTGLTEIKWISNIGFLLVFIWLCWFFNYHVTFFKPPQSVHTWRQTNSLSITQMYYQYKCPFFEPEIQNQFADRGKSGKTIAEFPILYYLMAKIWQLIGKSEWSFRVLHLVIIFIGLFSLFRLLIPITGNAIRAGFISSLIFTSPMFIFFGPNFLPDAPALAFTFLAWYFLYRFIKYKRKYYFLWISAAFFFLAMSLKVITATGFIAIGSWALFEKILTREDNRIFRFKFKHYLPFVISFLLVLAWFKYTLYYNNLHMAEYSVSDIWPIWKTSKEKLNQVLDALEKIYFKEFLFPNLQYATVLIWLFLLVVIKKLSPFFRYLIIIMPLGMASVLALWFEVLQGHDYYMISQFQVLVIVWAAFFSYLKGKRLWNNPIIYIALIYIVSILAENGRIHHNDRYRGWWNEGYKKNLEAYTEVAPYFDKWGIGDDDLVISIPDNSIATTLYYMNRRGYTSFGNDFSKSLEFRKRIFQGAKWLIIKDKEILNDPVVQEFATDSVGQYRNIIVYRLNRSMNMQ